MIIEKIPYQDLRFFSSLMSDYLNQDERLQDLYHRFPSLTNFEAQIQEKKQEWESKEAFRTTLVKVLREQYDGLTDKDQVLANLDKLEQATTYTITTGHQLNLFTGPLYFLYKIISTINLCKQLKKEYPKQDFVPVYWMATEDHDFEEIQYFNFKDRKIVYQRESAGAVGRLATEGMDEVLDVFSKLLGAHKNALDLKNLFADAYLKHQNLADATRFIAHQLFQEEGLIVIDADHAQLKAQMIPSYQQELLDQTSFTAVSQTLESWPQEYNVQVNPREINLFYLRDGMRNRIIKEETAYYIDDTDITFSEAEIMAELKEYPERFSPNVIMRPLYQEAILPNLCYIGGGGEMAYWLQLKEYFQSEGVVFPILLLRNSALLVTEKQFRKVQKLPIGMGNLFLKEHQLAEKVTRAISDIEIDFGPQKQALEKQFEGLYQLAQQTDPSFRGAVGAQERKQIKGLEHLEKRLLKAQKRKLSDQVERSLLIQKQLFPNNSLQERQDNFSSFYEAYGPKVIEVLEQDLDPLDLRFTVIQLSD